MRGLTAGALRFRSGQAVALFVLSTLAVAACAFGPLYERAVEQAQLRLTLANTPVFARGVSARAVDYDVGQYMPAGALAKHFRAPVDSEQVAVQFAAGDNIVAGAITSRGGLCAHLPVVAGRCATGAHEVVASAPAARVLGISLGERLPLTLDPPGSPVLHGATATVVGLYRPFDPDDDYWFGHEYSSTSGVQPTLGGTAGYTADTFFAADAFAIWLTDDISKHYKRLTRHLRPRPPLPDFSSLGLVDEADAALRVDSVGLDDIAALRTGVAELIASSRAFGGAAISNGPTGDVEVRSSVAAALDEVEHGRHQARSVIPAFAVELALLVLVVVAIVVAAAAEQRRPELALARLRGRGAGRAARLLDRELGVPVLLSIVPGLLAAWAGCQIAAGQWLSGAARPQLRWLVLAAAGAVVVAELAIVAVATRATARKPVHELLRRVPRRSARLGLGVVEAALAAAAVAGLVVTLSGGRHNALAVITPGFVALLAGLVLGRILALAARVLGQRALWRGRVSAGLAGLQLARRPAMRNVVTLLCVAVALVVSAADQWRVSARNRAVRADAEAGASVVLDVRAHSAATLRDAVSAADPNAGYATPVVVQNPVNGPAVVAVELGSFGRVAAWGWAKDHPSTAMLRSLTPHRPAPIRLTGSTLQLRLSRTSLDRVRSDITVGEGHRSPVYLLFSLRNGARGDVAAKLGPLPDGAARAAVFRARVPCTAGCRLTGITLLRDTGDADTIRLSARIDGLSAGQPGALRRVALGRSSAWADVSGNGSDDNQQMRLHSGPHGLVLSVRNAPGGTVRLQQLNVPLAVAALLSADVRNAPGAGGYLSDNGIDGIATSYQQLGRLPVLPGAGGPALLVDLDIAEAVATPTLGDSMTQVWLARDDPQRERALVASLARHGVTVTGRDTAAAHRAVLAQSAPAWAMQLALVTAVLAVLIAAIVIAIAAAASRRSWAYDMSALELVGMRRAAVRRAALLEQTIAAIAAVLVGTVMGLVGARLALPTVPMFLDEVSQPAVLLPTAWTSAGAAALLTLVALVAAGALVALALVRQVAPTRVQGGQQ